MGKSMRRVEEGGGGGVQRGKRCQHELWLGSTSEGGTQQQSMRVRAIQHREEGMGPYPPSILVGAVSAEGRGGEGRGDGGKIKF